jgi:gluconolactonase
MSIRTLATGLGFTEGPVFRTTGDVVVVSMTHACIYRVTLDGTSEVFAKVGARPNGLTEGADGRIFVAQKGGGRPSDADFVPGGVQVVSPDGEISWLTQDPICPNDLCFGPDRLLYVTDPTRNGLRNDGRLWRCDPDSGEAQILTPSLDWYPNGIGFAREDDAVYVANSGGASIWRFPFSASGLGPGELVIQMADGLPDGFAFDADNNIVIGAVGVTHDEPGSIQTWSLDGELLDEFRPGDSHSYTNVAFDSNSGLIVTDATAGGVLIVDDWPHAGLPLHPYRTASRAHS